MKIYMDKYENVNLDKVERIKRCAMKNRQIQRLPAMFPRTNKRYLQKMNAFTLISAFYTCTLRSLSLSAILFLSPSVIDIKCVIQSEHLKSNRQRITAKL